MAARFRVEIEPDLLKACPSLCRELPLWVESNEINSLINSISDRGRGMQVAIHVNVVKILCNDPRFMPADPDILGLERADELLKQVCDVVREFTNLDPRRAVLYAKRGSAFENLSDEAMIEPNYLNRNRRRRHALDRISCEEITERRRLAESKWNNQLAATQQPSRESQVHDEERTEEVLQFFFPNSKKK